MAHCDGPLATNKRLSSANSERRTTPLGLSQQSTRSSRTKRSQIGGANSSGTTKPDLTRRNYWRTIQNGNLQLLFTKNWPGLGAAGAMKQRRGSTACDWNIFFGRIDNWL